MIGMRLSGKGFLLILSLLIGVYYIGYKEEKPHKSKNIPAPTSNNVIGYDWVNNRYIEKSPSQSEMIKSGQYKVEIKTTRKKPKLNRDNFTKSQIRDLEEYFDKLGHGYSHSDDIDIADIIDYYLD